MRAVGLVEIENCMYESEDNSATHLFHVEPTRVDTREDVGFGFFLKVDDHDHDDVTRHLPIHECCSSQEHCRTVRLVLASESMALASLANYTTTIKF